MKILENKEKPQKTLIATRGDPGGRPPAFPQRCAESPIKRGTQHTEETQEIGGRSSAAVVIDLKTKGK